MGICMWNTGNTENTDYGQMGITEDYLMWFSFMYGLQSDYYLVLLILHLSLLVPCPVWTSICILSLLPLVLVRLPTFVQLHSLSPCSCTPLPSLASDIGWTCIRSPPTRLRFPIHRTISHAVRAPLFVLTPTGLVSTCPLVFPWFNMTKRVTLAYMSPPRSSLHYRPTPGPMSIVRDGSHSAGRTVVILPSMGQFQHTSDIISNLHHLHWRHSQPPWWSHNSLGIHIQVIVFRSSGSVVSSQGWVFRCGIQVWEFTFRGIHT